MPKTYHRWIRINGKMKKSPPFKRAGDASNWYSDQLRQKQHLSSGMPIALDDRTTLNVYFDTAWLPTRKKEYTKATWGSDEQRFNDYVRPNIGGFKASKINSLQIRHCLSAITQKHGLSGKTRNKVRSLLSKVFGDAMLEERPLRLDNPALGIKFKDARIGQKRPAHIAKEPDIRSYLNAAREVGPLVDVIVCTLLMCALRKSELIPRRWKDFDSDLNEFAVDTRFVQADKKIMSGTKAGREEYRVVSTPDALTTRLKAWREQSKFNSSNDFIFCDKSGKHLKPRRINAMLERVSAKSGVKASPHALRHSFGRWFIANGGRREELQVIMGHSNQKTTEVYSELVAEQVKRERNRVSFEVEHD